MARAIKDVTKGQEAGEEEKRRKEGTQWEERRAGDSGGAGVRQAMKMGGHSHEWSGGGGQEKGQARP